MEAANQIQAAINHHGEEVANLYRLYNTEPDLSLRTAVLAARVHGPEFQDQLFRILGPSLSDTGSDFDGEDQEEKSKIKQKFSGVMDWFRGGSSAEGADTTDTEAENQSQNDQREDDKDKERKKILGMHPWAAAGVGVVAVLVIIFLWVKYGSGGGE